MAGNLTINPLPLAPAFTASNKVYDGTTTATILTRTLTGTVIGTDVVSLSGGTATFAFPNVGTWTVTGSGFTLTGAVVLFAGHQHNVQWLARLRRVGFSASVLTED